MSNPALLQPEPLSLRQHFERLRGSTITHDLRPYTATLEEIHRRQVELRRLGDADLLARSQHLVTAAQSRDRKPDDDVLETLLPAAFALVCETARRTLGLDPFDVQVVAGIALHRGKVVEMQTGEGKTLAAVLPAYLNALCGRGVHLLTFNDYLARRDAEWMGPIYRALGLSVAWVTEGLSTADRRRAYGADVTYLTAQEAGFDSLRDGLCTEADDRVHRPFHFALVDEADSLLIDEARIPLVLAGSVERDASTAPRLAEVVRRLEPGLDYEVMEYQRNVELTEAGLERAESELGCGDLYSPESYQLLTELNCALHAEALLRRDVDYIVRDGRLELIDEFTGRVAEDRHWPDGLQAALEAKEGVQPRSDGRILGSITLQHFLTGYTRLCGMTGTAQDGAPELKDFYDLDVVVIPTHRPSRRADQPDVVFTHREAKDKALVGEIQRVHATGRPILVGTLTVRESEALAERLRHNSIPCQILNAKQDALEAEIVAGAGALGAITISTNMAGRGTDIRLGGADEADRQRVVELGGLYVLGTNRHESRRIDMQLRGRAGRQGDPGESRFFLSLEDDLLQRYGIRELIPPRWLPETRDAPISSAVVRREIARAQRIIEGQNYDLRKTLWRYSMPIEEQRRRLEAERLAIVQAPRTATESLPASIWRDAGSRYRELVAAVGEQAVHRAEKIVLLFCVDQEWSEHLARVATLREGIHLVGLGGEDPLTRFRLRAAESFNELWEGIESRMFDALERVPVARDADGQPRLDLESLDVQGPSSTWTYLVHDDPFRQQLGQVLTAPGQGSMTIAGAVVAAPLLMLWMLADRLLKKRRRSAVGERRPPKKTSL